jgi:hypothetical protein
MDVGVNDDKCSPVNLLSALKMSNIVFELLLEAQRFLRIVSILFRKTSQNLLKAERRIRNTNLSVHQQMYRDVCVNANKLLLRCKKEYFPTKIEEAELVQKQLFQLSKSIMGDKHEIILPKSYFL